MNLPAAILINELLFASFTAVATLLSQVPTGPRPVHRMMGKRSKPPEHGK